MLQGALGLSAADISRILAAAARSGAYRSISSRTRSTSPGATTVSGATRVVWAAYPVLDAVVLTGGSAFGLASADGVMTYLAEREKEKYR